MCPESFGGDRFDIILCISPFNHVPSGDPLRRDAISSLFYAFPAVNILMRLESGVELESNFNIYINLLFNLTFQLIF